MITTQDPPINGNGKAIPPRGSITSAQSFNTRIASWVNNYSLFGPGGNWRNPLNFTGWNGHYFGTTWVYDWMLRHPRIQQARQNLLAPIISSSWAFECDEGFEDQRDFIASNWNRLRPVVVPDALRAVDYGNAKFEPVWNQDSDGKWVIEQFKPLDVDMTGLWSDPGGNFTGFSVSLRTDLTDDERQRLNIDAGGPNLPAFNGKAWLFAYDKKNGYLHGRSILENLRETAWIPWLTTAQQIVLTGGKVSGKQAYGMVPPGGYTLPDGTTRTYMQDMEDAMLAFIEGKNPIFTNLSPEAEDKEGWVDPELKAKLAGKTLTQFGQIDFGNNGPALAAMLSELDHYEDLMFAGFLLSSRTGMQSKHGSRADSEQHTDTGKGASQIIGDSLASQAQPLVDFQCRLNFNLRPGSVRIRQAPLEDVEAQVANELMNTLCQSNKDISLAVARVVDWKKNFAAQRIPVMENVDIAGLLEEAANRPQPQPFGGAGVQPADGKISAALSRSVGRLAGLLGDDGDDE